jgi:hypothetical protein
MKRYPRESEGIFHGVYSGRGAGADDDVSRYAGVKDNPLKDAEQRISERQGKSQPEPADLAFKN